jgi:hypothetical protein
VDTSSTALIIQEDLGRSARYQISSAAVHVITGSLGDDPMAWATQSGRPMTVFSVKVVRRVKVKVAEEVQTRVPHDLVPH